MKLRNRLFAAELLSERLVAYRGQRSLLLGVPRGGVPMARVIADRLAADLDIALVQKIGASEDTELPIGAIDETGHVYLTDFAREVGVSPDYLERQKRRLVDRLRQRRRQYTRSTRPIDPAHRIVIVIDDGMRSGATMSAAVRSLRERHATRVVVAVAVSPLETVRRLALECDEVVHVTESSPLDPIHSYFEDFTPVGDDEVIEAINPLHIH